MLRKRHQILALLYIALVSMVSVAFASDDFVPVSPIERTGEVVASPPPPEGIFDINGPVAEEYSPLQVSGPPPPLGIDEANADSTTAGVNCPFGDQRCNRKPIRVSAYDRISVWNQAPAPSEGYSSVAACYGQHLVDVAKRRTPRRFTRFGGFCAQYVDNDMKAAGIGSATAMHGKLDGAIEWWHLPQRNYGILEEMGYTNEVGRYNADNAPTGAVLVFAGPLSDQYESSGHMPAFKNRGGQGAGEWLGHVTIKSTPGDGYLTQGHTVYAAAHPEPRRHLVGVYVLNHCTTCTVALKRKCGDY